MDDLIAAIEDVRDKLRRGVFSNEDQVSKGVVMRLLQQLGWDVFNPDLVSSEFKINNRKVDYALRHEPFGAVVLIEVKDVGKATAKGEDQLFDYCSKYGVPLAVLTDGRTWNFYLPAGMGNYEQRRFAVADLIQDGPSECAARLVRYLEFSAVRSGASQQNARREYDAYRNQILAREKYEAVFETLVAQGDLRVVRLFCGEVEARCGIRPDVGDVRNYLRTRSEETVVRKGMSGRPTSAPEHPPVPAESRRRTRRSKPPRTGKGPAQDPQLPAFSLFGSNVSCRNDAEVLVGVITALGERDPGLYGRAAPRFAGKTRRFLSRDRNQIYPEGSSEQVLRAVQALPGGWWLGTHSSTHEKNEQLKRIRDVAGLSRNELSWQMKGKT